MHGEGDRYELLLLCKLQHQVAGLQAFSAWIHTCAVRLFTESILRYGLPPQFLGVLMKPNAKAQNKLRKSLASVFGSTGVCASPLLIL